MKIEKIEKEGWVYKVHLVPNWLEKLFGKEPTVKEFKDNGAEYTFGGGTVYVGKDGKKLGNGHWIGERIDEWRRRW